MEGEKIKNRLLKFGIQETEIEKALTAIKEVWASKFNERVFISVGKIGISIDKIKMAILVQKIIPAEYAFVIHTKNPSSNDENELYAEVVYGMGEALVGFHEGQAFSFTYNKTTKEYSIKSYPNKSLALLNEGFIFRSDSNTEDLEGFAGAGLFDSVPINSFKLVKMAYHKNALFTDEKFVSDRKSVV